MVSDGWTPKNFLFGTSKSLICIQIYIYGPDSRLPALLPRTPDARPSRPCGCGCDYGKGNARQGNTKQGNAMQGKARQAKAMRGNAIYGKVRQSKAKPWVAWDSYHTQTLLCVPALVYPTVAEWKARKSFWCVFEATDPWEPVLHPICGKSKSAGSVGFDVEGHSRPPVNSA